MRMPGYRVSQVKKVPSSREIVLHEQVADLLTDHANPFWQWTHFPAGEKRSKATGAKLKRMGLQPGWPDFQLICPNTRIIHFLEIKRIGEDLNDNQIRFQSWCGATGVPHGVAQTIDEVLEIFWDWDCIAIRSNRVEPS